MSNSIFNSYIDPEVIEIIKSRSIIEKASASLPTRPVVSIKPPAKASIECVQIKSCGVGSLASYISEHRKIGNWEDPEKGYEFFDTIIRDAKHFKPRPILKRMVVRESKSQNYPIVTCEAEIECFTKSDFESVANLFCMPGNVIEFEMDYGLVLDLGFSYGTYPKNKFPFRMKGEVSTWGFSTTDSTWVCNFSAINQGSSITSWDMSNIGQKYSIGVLQNKTTSTPKGMMGIIEYDSLINGLSSFDSIPRKDHGIVSFSTHVPIGFSRPNAPKIDPYAATKALDFAYTQSCMGIAVVNPDFLSVDPSETPVEGSSKKDELSSKSKNLVYCNLAYIVERLINTELKRVILEENLPQDYERNRATTIYFSEIKSWANAVDFSWTMSGAPADVLILGMGAGNYYCPAKLIGKNFETDLLAYPQFNSKKPVKGVELSKILIEQNLIDTCYNRALDKAKTKIFSASEKVLDRPLVDPIEFLSFIFDEINRATAGHITLACVLDPDDPIRQSFIIVDSNRGSKVGPIVVQFDPVDSDGNTQTCSISTGGGSANLRMAMLTAAHSNEAEIASTIRGCEPELKTQRAKNYTDYSTKLTKFLYEEGKLPANGFNSYSQAELISLLRGIRNTSEEIHGNMSLVSSGMKMEITINGVHGWTYGNWMTSTQVPDFFWQKYNAAFMITSVEHVLEENRWNTNLSGIFGVLPNGVLLPLSAESPELPGFLGKI